MLLWCCSIDAYWMISTKVLISKTGVTNSSITPAFPEPVYMTQLMSQKRGEVICIVLTSRTSINLRLCIQEPAVVKEPMRHPHFVQSYIPPLPIRSDVPRRSIERNLETVTLRKTAISLPLPPPRRSISSHFTPHPKEVSIFNRELPRTLHRQDWLSQPQMHDQARAAQQKFSQRYSAENTNRRTVVSSGSGNHTYENVGRL